MAPVTFSLNIKKNNFSLFKIKDPYFFSCKSLWSTNNDDFDSDVFLNNINENFSLVITGKIRIGNRIRNYVFVF